MSLEDEALLGSRAGILFAPARSYGWNLVSTRLTQFSYFDQLLGSPVWRGRKILDFGGNVGTFLAAAGDKIHHDDYWCIDLNAAVIEDGRRSYPQAHFVHYNRYSSQYNPNGVRHLPLPDCGVEFDIILAFSVFTHVDRGEMLELVGELSRRLASGGVLAFTFFDPYYDRSLSDPALPPGTSALEIYFAFKGAEEAQTPARWYVLIDDDLYVEPEDSIGHQIRTGKPLESYTSYFTAEYMASLFPGADVLPPVSPELQHCCVLQKVE